MNWLADALKLILGVVVGALATILAEELLGPKLRVTFAAWRKRLGRLMRDDPVTGILAMRLDLASPSDEEEVDRVVEGVLRSVGATDISRQADMIRASTRQGRTNIQIRVVPMHHTIEEDGEREAGLVDALKLEMTCQVSYRPFYEVLADLTAMLGKLTAGFARERILADDKSRAFALDMSTLPELAGFFAVLRTDSFTANIKDGEARLDYYDRRLEVKGPLDSGTLRVIRDAILFGF